ICRLIETGTAGVLLFAVAGGPRSRPPRPRARAGICAEADKLLLIERAIAMPPRCNDLNRSRASQACWESWHSARDREPIREVAPGQVASMTKPDRSYCLSEAKLQEQQSNVSLMLQYDSSRYRVLQRGCSAASQMIPLRMLCRSLGRAADMRSLL